MRNRSSNRFSKYLLNSPLRVLSISQKMMVSIKDFFSKCDQIRSFLNRSLLWIFIFCVVFLWLLMMQFRDREIDKFLTYLIPNLPNIIRLLDMIIRCYEYLCSFYTRSLFVINMQWAFFFSFLSIFLPLFLFFSFFFFLHFFLYFFLLFFVFAFFVVSRFKRNRNNQKCFSFIIFLHGPWE